MATVQPYVDKTGIQIIINDDLRECEIVNEYSVNFDEIMRQAWRDRRAHFPKCESASSCQRRFSRCVRIIVEDNPGATILVSSHGMAIGLYVAKYDSTFDYKDWRRLQSPALLKVTFYAGQPSEPRIEKLQLLR